MTNEERKALVQRLRGRTSCNEILLVHPPRPAPDRDCHYAADQIEADGQRIDELEAALRDVTPTTYFGEDEQTKAYWAKARAALGDKK